MSIWRSVGINPRFFVSYPLRTMGKSHISLGDVSCNLNIHICGFLEASVLMSNAPFGLWMAVLQGCPVLYKDLFGNLQMHNRPNLVTPSVLHQ